MAVSAAPRVEMAWVCPECGHGSPEPRDSQAHLDAHRQLRQFIDAWDAAAATDQAAERRRRDRPLYALAVALVVAVLAASTYRGIGGRDRTATPPPAAPAPGVDVRPGEPGLPVTTVPRSPGPGRASTPTSPPPAARLAVRPAPGAASEASAESPAADGDAPPAPGALLPSPVVLHTVPPAPTEPPPHFVTVQGCLLVVCLYLGG